jgi:hypothetical protein
MDEGVNEMLQVNDTVVLTAKTRHGKNRIQQHGDRWLVEEVRGTSMMLRSENKTFKLGDKFIHDGRWVELQNDPNFDWVKGV